MIFFSSSNMKKRCAQSLLVAMLFVWTFGFVPQARAGVWGESIAATLMDQVITTVKRSIEGAILGTLKVAAIEILNSKVGQMVGGGSGDPLFITDWNEFLYDTPAQQARLYMNDFFTITTRGKYSSANYTGIGDAAANITGNYPAYLVARSQSVIAAQSEDGMTAIYDLDEFTANPATMFAEGDWRGYNAFFSNPANNPFGYSIMAQGAYANRLATARESARVEAQSSGFIGQKKNGRTIAPAATIAGMVTNVQNIGNNMIATATNPGEFLTGVVSAVVNKTITSFVQAGVGKIQAKIQREVRNVDNQVAGALNNLNKQLGPAAKFTREADQKVNVVVKTYTPPPPSACGTGAGPC